jgi:phage shock protein C
MTKRLVRSRTDAVLGGVCGGLGEYFGVDSNLVRLIFIIFCALTGFGVLVYLAAWLIVPEIDSGRSDLSDRVKEAADEIADRARSIGEGVRRGTRRPERGAAFFLGFALILLGVAFLLRNLGVVWIRWFTFGMLWPVFPILIGLAFLWRCLRGGR